MIEAIGGTFWLGLGITLKPGAIVIGILIASRGDSWRRGLAYLLGWLCGLLALVILPSLYLHDLLRVPADVAREHFLRYDIFRAGLGVILLAAAVVALVKGPLPDDQIPESRWARLIETGGVLRTFGIGIFVSAVSLRNLVLLAAAGSVIDQADLNAFDLAIVVAVFVTVASLGILVPLLLQRFGGAWTKDRLQAVADWLTGHMGLITGVTMALLGAMLLSRGVLEMF
jgi:threonine/homoserine/homoserine lactone efflux protein